MLACKLETLKAEVTCRSSQISCGVSCVSARSCAAVGSDASEGGPSQTLVETSKGGKWSIVPSANSASGQTKLDGVSCTSTESCFAVGNQGSVHTLVESGGI